MLIHCRLCDAVECVSTEHLQPYFKSTSDLDDLTLEDEPSPNHSEGIPYKFEEIVVTIREALPLWNIITELDQNGVETLKLTCHNHLSSEEIIRRLKSQFSN